MLVGALALLSAGGASAASGPFALGQTTILSNPSVVVDGSGNAYAAWDSPISSAQTDTIWVCEIPAGARKCTHLTHHQGPTGLSTGVEPFLFIDRLGHLQLIVSGRNGATAQEIEYSSADQGATWSSSPANPIGDLTLDSAAFDPGLGTGSVFGTSIEGPSNAYNVAVNAAELGQAGPQPDATLVPFGQNGSLSSATGAGTGAAADQIVSAWDGGTANSSHGVGYGFYTGPPLGNLSSAAVAADVGSPENWAVRSLHDNGGNIAMAGGPAGVYLAESVGNEFHAPSLRMLEPGVGLGHPAQADCGDTARYGAGTQGTDVYENPANGTLALVYIEANGQGTEDIRYTELRHGSQSAPITLHRQTGHGNETQPRVAVDGAHPGLVIWLQSANPNDLVRAEWLPLVNPGAGCPQTSVTARVGNQRLKLSSPPPADCHALGTALRVRLSSQTLSSGAKEKFTRADFFIGHSKRATTHHLPVTETLSLAGLASGTHSLRVRSYFTHGAHTVEHTISQSLEICPA